MSASPKYRGGSLGSGTARPVRIAKTKCANPKLSGPVGGSCEPVPGGTPAIKAPGYILTVKNSSLNLGDCDAWQDDDDQLFKEDNNEVLCIDNA